MPNRKNYGFDRTERIGVRLTKKEKEDLVKLGKIYHRCTSDCIRLLIRSYADYFQAVEEERAKGVYANENF